MQNWADFENTRQKMQFEIEDFFRGSERERNACGVLVIKVLRLYQILACIDLCRVIDSAPTKQEDLLSKWFADRFTRIPRTRYR